MNNYITESLVHSSCKFFPIAKVKIFIVHWMEIVIGLNLCTEQRQLYFLSQVLYLSGEFCMLNDFSFLYSLANSWKKYNLNILADAGDFYGITRILSPKEHDLGSLDYLEKLVKNKKLTTNARY